MSPVELFTKFLERYKIVLISISIVIFYFICLIETKNFKCENDFLFFLVILSFVHILYEFFSKILIPTYNKYQEKKESEKYKNIKIEQSINYFTSLPEEEQNILYKVFFKEQDRFYEYKIRNLLSNCYLEIVQNRKCLTNITMSEPIVQLNKDIEIFLQEKFDEKISNDLKTLNENELIIFEMFIQEADQEFEHPIMENKTYNCLYELNRKKLLVLSLNENRFSIHPSIKSFALTSYAKKNFNSFSEKSIKREVINVDLTKVKAG